MRGLDRHIRNVTAGVASTILFSCNIRNDNPVPSIYGDNPPFRIDIAFFIGNLESRSLKAIHMAEDDINESKIFDRIIDINHSFFSDRTDRRKFVDGMFSLVTPNAVISQWSSTAIHILHHTNKDYPDVVQCSSDSTSTYINDRNFPNSGETITSDKNDTLYRVVANDRHQANVIWSQIDNKEKFALVYIDDLYGNSLKDELTKLYFDMFQREFPPELLMPYPDKNFVISKHEGELDTLLTKNKEGSITSLVIAGISYEGSHILQYLTEREGSFHGHVILSDGMIDISLFEPLGEEFGGWLTTEGNSLTGISPEMDVGEHNEEWNRRLDERTKQKDIYAAGAASCVYLIALALLSVPEKDRFQPGSLKAGFMNFLAKNIPKNEEEVFDVAPNVESLRMAKSKADTGIKLRLNGPSGKIMFDDDGDRLDQTYKKLRIKIEDNRFSFEKDLP